MASRSLARCHHCGRRYSLSFSPLSLQSSSASASFRELKIQFHWWVSTGARVCRVSPPIASATGSGSRSRGNRIIRTDRYFALVLCSSRTRECESDECTQNSAMFRRRHSMWGSMQIYDVPMCLWSAKATASKYYRSVPIVCTGSWKCNAVNTSHWWMD